MPATATNYATTPDSAATSITGSIDLRVKAAPGDWSPAWDLALINKMGSWGSAQESYRFYLNSLSKLVFMISNTGGDGGSSGATSTVGTGFVDGTTHWVRVTWDSSSKDVVFYTSDDGTAWTQLGTAVTIGIASIFNGTAPVRLGDSFGLHGPTAWTLHKAEIRSGIGGSVVASFDANAVTKLGTRNPTTWVAPTGETWTMTGTTWDWVNA